MCVLNNVSCPRLVCVTHILPVRRDSWTHCSSSVLGPDDEHTVLWTGAGAGLILQGGLNPLFYLPGEHRIPKGSWKDGLRRLILLLIVLFLVLPTHKLTGSGVRFDVPGAWSVRQGNGRRIECHPSKQKHTVFVQHISYDVTD